MFSMILQMSGLTLLYVVMTVLLWRFWHKSKEHSLRMKLAVGLFYGLCSVASSHFGVDYGSMVLNVRDIGPLAAGLFFDPLAGILSGLIGGVERFIIGEYFGIGSFTRVACSVSTCLAGLLSAALHRWVYEGKRPSATHSFFLGAVMEVFHMYVVLITHRDQMYIAYAVVRICALPMILFTGFGMMACSVIILRLSGGAGAVHLWTPRKNTPLAVRFQRWLLVVTLALFVISTASTYTFQQQMAFQNASDKLVLEREYEMNRYHRMEAKEPLQSYHSFDLMSDPDMMHIVIDVKHGQIVSGFDIEEPVPLSEDAVARVIGNAGGEAWHEKLPVYYNEPCLCVSSRLTESNYLLLFMSSDAVYDIENRLYETILSEILIFTALYVLIALLTDRIVVRNLEKVNESLNRITGGDLEEVVSVEESSEFTRLSQDINETVATLRGYIDAEKKRMEEDLKLAASIQESALPRVFRFPRSDFEIYALMDPAKQVGGDFYDFFFIDTKQMALVIADVSGKSVPAALFMMRAKTAIKNLARSGHSPAELLAGANNVLCEGNEAEMFVTAWIGIVDLSTGLLRCANAGHEYPLIMRAGEEYTVLKDKHSLPLGTMEGVRMKEYEVQLQPGDHLLVYTDGIPEAINEQEEAYGVDRLLRKANELRGGHQQSILEGIYQDVKAFSGTADQFDDITMLGFTWLGPSS